MGSIGSEAQKSRSRRCHGREQLVELIWYPGGCAEGTLVSISLLKALCPIPSGLLLGGV